MSHKKVRYTMTEESFRLFEPFMLCVLSTESPLILDPKVAISDLPLSQNTFRSRFNEARLGALRYGYNTALAHLPSLQCSLLADGRVEIHLKGEERRNAPPASAVPPPVALDTQLDPEQSAFLDALKSTLESESASDLQLTLSPSEEEKNLVQNPQ